jgi:hypothetical protein
MIGKSLGAASRAAGIVAIVVVLTVSYAFLVGFSPFSSSQNAQGVIGDNGSQVATATTTTATSISLQTTTITSTYTTSSSDKTQTVVETTTMTLTTTQSSTSCTVGECIWLTPISSTSISRNSRVSFRAVTSDPQEMNYAFTAFMDCGCNGGIVHGNFTNGVAVFSVDFTLTGAQRVWVAGGDQATNATTTVYSNVVPVTVS